MKRGMTERKRVGFAAVDEEIDGEPAAETVATATEEVVPRPPAPSTTSTPHKGILKHGETERKKRCVMWDEANIELCEAGKDAQMKIDEPNTPYNFMAMSRSDSEDEDDEDGGAAKARAVPPPQSLDEALKRLTTEHQSDDENSTLTEEEKQRRHKEFEERRKKHYNEFLAVKKYREEKLRQLQEEKDKQQEEDGDDDDGKDETKEADKEED